MNYVTSHHNNILIIASEPLLQLLTYYYFTEPCNANYVKRKCYKETQTKTKNGIWIPRTVFEYLLLARLMGQYCCAH